MLLQRTAEWHSARRGKVTASRIEDIVRLLRNGNYSAARKNYAAELVTQRLTGKDPEVLTNEYIEWGIAQEPFAREAYTQRTGNVVVEVGFIDHPRLPYAGASPDGLVGDDGLIEIKCPSLATHIETLLTEEVKDQYRYQMLWQMVCTGRKWCDFVSFDPRAAPDMQLFIKRFERDEVEIENLEMEVSKFLNEVADTVSKLQEKYGKSKG